MSDAVQKRDQQIAIALIAAVLLSHKPFDGNGRFAGLLMDEKRMAISEARDLLEMAGAR